MIFPRGVADNLKEMPFVCVSVSLRFERIRAFFDPGTQGAMRKHGPLGLWVPLPLENDLA